MLCVGNASLRDVQASMRGFAATRRDGHGQNGLEPRREAIQRSKTSSSPCLCRLDLSPRAAMETEDRDVKRDTPSFNFLWSRNLVQGRF